MPGAFQETGPLWTTTGGRTLEPNTWSWNNFSTTLYLEAPICVGFSYADASVPCVASDNSTAADNLQAVIKFFALFPEFQANDFWITGESYAGCVRAPAVNSGLCVWAGSPPLPATVSPAHPTRRFPSNPPPCSIYIPSLAYNIINYNAGKPATPIKLKGGVARRSRAQATIDALPACTSPLHPLTGNHRRVARLYVPAPSTHRHHCRKRVHRQ